MDHAAWLCDLDGTLYRPLPVKLAMGAELVLRGRRHLPWIRAFRHEHERLRETLAEPVASPYDVQLERAAAAAGCSTDALRGIVSEWMVERPCRWIRRFARTSFLDEVRAFRARGGRAAVVSDYPASRKLEALDAAGLFETVVSNGEPGGPGRLKPWPDGYLAAAERLGVDPSACLVIGDRDDAEAAILRAWARRVGAE